MTNNKLTFFSILPLLLSMVVLSGCQQKNQVPATTIAFGSCANQDIPQPILGVAASYKPDLFVFLGDNIYGDTDNMDTLKAKYVRWAAQPYFQKLKQSTRFLATWDDHDFGRNDAGRHYPFKKESKEIFLNFFEEPVTSERRKHEGIYHDEYIKVNGRVVQLILLDNRTFRDDLRLYDSTAATPRSRYFYTLDYSIHETPDSTILGSAQWKWLESVLKKPADIRLICSGSQFSIEYNGYEAWANFPYEQQRMISLIQKTKANGVVFLTGDVHYGEISRLNVPAGYPIYDITSSGITSTWSFATPNANRIEGPIMDNNIGLLTIRWEKDPVLDMQLIDAANNSRVQYSVRLSEISFK
ncbi:MAG: alkaline phosphatase family protein [Chitinophagia bacterium]|nr:alkaline phosphatase family protein [Chitinophagia bacterium]